MRLSCPSLPTYHHCDMLKNKKVLEHSSPSEPVLGQESKCRLMRLVPDSIFAQKHHLLQHPPTQEHNTRHFHLFIYFFYLEKHFLPTDFFLFEMLQDGLSWDRFKNCKIFPNWIVSVTKMLQERLDCS